MVMAHVVMAHVVMARAQRASVTAGAAAASLQEPLARAGGGTIFSGVSGCISASPTARVLRGLRTRRYSKNDRLGDAVILSTGASIPAQ